jgi:hypothetical protein
MVEAVGRDGKVAVWSLVWAGTWACTPEPERLHLVPPWPAGETGVVLVERSDGELIARTPAVISAEVPFSGDGEPPLRVTFLQFDGRTQQDLASCGVQLFGERARVPRPTAAWASEVTEAGVSTAAPIPVPGREFRFDRCDPPTPCDRIKISSTKAPLMGLNPILIEWLPEDRWLVVGTTPSSSVGPTRMAILEPNGPPTLLDEVFDEPFASSTRDIDDQVWLSSVTGRLFRLALEPRPHLLEEPRPGFSGPLVSRPDGLLILHNEGARLILRQPAGAPVLLDDFPDQLRNLTMASPDRMAATRGGEVLRWGGATWRPGLVVPRIHFEDRLLYAGGRLIVFGPTFIFREDDDGDLVPTPDLPAALVGPRSPTPFGDGLLIGGDVGGAAYLEGDRWCFLKTEGSLSALRASAVSPDGRTALHGIDPGTPRIDPTIMIWQQ